MNEVIVKEEPIPMSSDISGAQGARLTGQARADYVRRLLAARVPELSEAEIGAALLDGVLSDISTPQARRSKRWRRVSIRSKTA